jgi:hypothetical protein
MKRKYDELVFVIGCADHWNRSKEKKDKQKDFEAIGRRRMMQGDNSETNERNRNEKGEQIQ